MENNEAAYAVYKSSFPSDDWVRKYFGSDVVIPGNPHRGEVSTGLYDGLRRAFNSTLAYCPKRILKAMDGKRTGFKRVYVFKDGAPAEWVDPELESHGLMIELPPEAFEGLCREFITHYEAGALPSNDWLKWCAEGSSIWVEIRPEALVNGRIKRRSLADILGKHQ